MTEYARLVIEVDSTSAKRATDDLRNFDRQAANTERSTTSMVAAFRPLAGIFASFKVAQFVKETTLLSSRYNELGIVMEVVGRNAGYSRSQLDALEQGLKQTGISAIESRSNIAKMVSANIDLANATDLARLAQDAAVIGGLNSSEAFARLIRGIQTAEVETLRNIGLNVSFERSYSDLADQLGKTTDALSEQEKVQARTNAVMSAAPNIAGAYEASLDNAGKQLRSSTRYLEDFRVKLGQIAQPAFNQGVEAYAGSLKFLSENVEGVAQALETGLYVVMARGTTVVATNTAALVAQAVQQAKNNTLIAEAAAFDVRKAEAAKLAALAELDKARATEAAAVAALAQARANQQLFALQVALAKGTAEYTALSKGLAIVDRELAAAEQAVAVASSNRAVATTAAAAAAGNLTKATAASTAASAASAASTGVASVAMRGALGVGSRLLGLLGGPIGLAFTIGAVALSFVDFSDSAEQAVRSSDKLEGSVNRLSTAAERSQRQFAGLIANIQNLNKVETEARAARIQEVLTRQEQNLARYTRLYEAGNRSISRGLIEQTRSNIEVLKDQLDQLGAAAAGTSSTKAGQDYLARLNEERVLLGAITEEERIRAQIKEGLLKVSAAEEAQLISMAKEIDAFKAAEDAAEESARAAEEAADRKKRASEEVLNLYASTAGALEREIALHGQNSAAARLNYELNFGSLQALSGPQKQRLRDLQDELDAKEALNEIQNINLELLRETGQERAARDLQFELEYAERIAEYERQGNEEALARLKVLRQIREVNAQPEPGTVEGVSKAPGSDFGGLNTTGFITDLERLDEQAKELEQWREQELERQREYLELKEIEEEVHAERVANIYEQSRERLESIEKARQDVMLQAGASFFGDMSDLAKVYAGEQSTIYKSLYTIQKAYSTVSVLLSSADAIGKAWASAPFPANLPAVAIATAETGALQALVSAATPGFREGGYTGNMGVSDVAGGGHGKAFVFDADATARIGVQNLEAMRRGQQAPAAANGDTYYNATVNARFAPGMTNQEVRRASSAVSRDVSNQLRKMQRFS